MIAKEIGLKLLEAEYVEEISQGEALYLRKLGYSVEGRKKKAFKLPGGTYVDKMVIGKVICPLKSILIFKLFIKSSKIQNNFMGLT